MLQHIRPAVVLLVLLSALTGLVYPLVVTGVAQVAFPAPGERQPDRNGRQCRRLGAHRAELQERSLLPSAPVGHHRHGPEQFVEDDRRALQRRQFGRLEPRADIAEARRPREGRRRRLAREGRRRRRSRPTPSRRQPRASIPTSRRKTRLRRLPPSPKRAASTRRRCAPLSSGRSRGRRSVSIGEPRVNVLQLNLALDQLKSS